MKKTYRCEIDWDATEDEIKGRNLPEEDEVILDDEMTEGMTDDEIGDTLVETLTNRHNFCIKEIYYDVEEDDAPSEDDILDRIGVLIDGAFGCVESVPGGLYIDEGGATYSVSVMRCDPE